MGVRSKQASKAQIVFSSDSARAAQSSGQSKAFDLVRFQQLVASYYDAFGNRSFGCGVSGQDFRNCWGDMVDFADRPVCGTVVMEEFVESVRTFGGVAGASTGGKSGDPVITAFKHFIVKPVDEVAQSMASKVIPDYSSAVQTWREKNPGSCWSSGLAPVCLLVKEHDQRYWQIMRKVTLEDADRYQVPVQGLGVDYMDLKGPFFANWYNDGHAARAVNISNRDKDVDWDAKPDMESEEFWRHKDFGFLEAFPQGVALQNFHAARGAQIAFIQDTWFLASHWATDYSLFLAFFEATAAEDYCSSDPSERKPPRFPVVLRARVGGREFDMAMGVIDWFESRVQGNVVKQYFSTMKRSVPYFEIFSQMWGKDSYFKVPDDAKSFGDTGAEKGFMCGFEAGGVVTAIEHMEFPDPGIFNTGATLKVYPTETGKLQSLGDPDHDWKDRLLFVRWDKREDADFEVRASQVVSGELARRFGF